MIKESSQHPENDTILLLPYMFPGIRICFCNVLCNVIFMRIKTQNPVSFILRYLIQYKVITLKCKRI